MRHLLPLVFLALAACEPPLEELFPPRFYVFERADVSYNVRAQFDPFEHGWFVEVLSIELPMSAGDLELATSLVEQDLGAAVCDGGLMHAEPGEVWNSLAGDQVMYLDGPETWRFVARCV